ncbi:MAG: Mth938-like domain-containing protein [Pikeienuella sp.]
MRMQEIDFEGQPPIDSFGAGGFRISHEFHDGHLLLTPNGQSIWQITPGALALEDFAPVLDDEAGIDLLLVGMGAEIAPIPATVRRAFDEAGIGIEAMSTGSACRTYNVLLAEDRRVAAALIAV